MRRLASIFFGILAFALAANAAAGQSWTEGTDYTLLSPVQHTRVPADKVEVMEVFSYGCIVCNRYQPTMEKLRHSLPANARMVFLPASFLPAEDWPMFQRAYFAAESLGISERTHQAVFDAVWTTGELAISDPNTHRLKNPQPTIEDAARCYERIAGVKPETFLAAARSFGVEMKMRAADTQVLEMQVPGTPCIVVNGKYRLNMESLRSTDDVIALVQYLVSKEARH
jgi:protein dithiol oxidoreductase (disulfide-forming)